MKILLNIFSILFIGSLFVNDVNATVFTSVKKGDFDSPSTWDVGGGQIPGEMDDIIIKHEVQLDLTQKVTIKSVSISNAANEKAGFEILGTDSLIVLNDVEATSYDFNKDLYFYLSESVIMVIHGNCNFLRVTQNDSDKYFDFSVVNDAELYIKGNFRFDYKGSGSGENATEIYVMNDGLLDVEGETVFTNYGGEDFNLVMSNNGSMILRDSLTLILSGTGDGAEIVLEDQSNLQVLASAYIFNSSTASSDFAKLRARGASSDIYITGNVYLETQGSVVKMEVGGSNGDITIGGDLVMNASAQEEVFVNITEQGELYLGGNIIRETSFGNLTMENDGAIIFNGSGSQTIPKSKLPDSGKDSLFFGKVILENTSSQPLVLTEDLIVQDSLILTNGNLKSDSTAMIVLEDGARIEGSSTAYVEGPIRKMGTSGGQDITFPIGTSSVFAPITISEITNSASDLTVQYYGEPPPFGAETFAVGVDNVSNDRYWVVEKNSNTGELDITLTWDDSNTAGISDTDDLIVVGWNGSEWVSHGQESSGTVGTGGYVTSLYSEPPPFGVEVFTIGSATSVNPLLNPLPVELSRFEALFESDRVYLKWQTESEINSSHFEVERSTNGVDFEKMETVNSRGSISTSTQYFVKDQSPFYGLNYYRLKIVDLDGTYEYSSIEVVNLKDAISALISPNPVQDVLHIEVTDWVGEDAMIEIFDFNATKIFENVIYFDGRQFQINTHDINVSTSGTYFIRITGKAGSKMMKFIKVE